jgi:hypothetical protein
MHAMQARFRRIGLILALAGCTGHVVGAIPPSQFQFKNTVKLGTGGQPGGWKAAQVIITLGSRYGVAVCQIEVGVPERNRVGLVSDIDAQLAAAEAADSAARVALGGGPRFSAIICRTFIDEMQRRLADEIEGARVSPFITAGLSPTRWP